MEIKKCPFCGGEAVMQTQTKRLLFSEEEEFYFISCTKCGAKPYLAGDVCLYYNDDFEERRKKLREKVIEAWNRRVDDGEKETKVF